MIRTTPFYKIGFEINYNTKLSKLDKIYHVTSHITDQVIIKLLTLELPFSFDMNFDKRISISNHSFC